MTCSDYLQSREFRSLRLMSDGLVTEGLLVKCLGLSTVKIVPLSATDVHWVGYRRFTSEVFGLSTVTIGPLSIIDVHWVGYRRFTSEEFVPSRVQIVLLFCH